MEEKINSSHLNRKAVVYIRQSTLHQVYNNKESQVRQYDLVNTAKEMGFRDVEVIDTDLGLSGGGLVTRPGFERLLMEVIMGKVGLVLSVEASRLARNSPDWAKLIDFCAILKTLIGDAHDIYDPNIANDRLLLGLKGTMSELESNQIKERMQAGLKSKASRGELYNRVATGYVKTSKTTIAKDPNRRVQEVFQQLFAEFERLQSAFGVYTWYQREEIKLPLRQGDQLRWDLPTFYRIHDILKNPVYAGVYARGRRKVVVVVEDMQLVRRIKINHDHESWDVRLINHHEGYISWERYLQNQAIMAQNDKKKSMAVRGPIQRGPAILQGLMWCRRCGAKMKVAYYGAVKKYPAYTCGGHRGHKKAEPCLRFGGRVAEKAVAEEVIRVVQPLAVTSALEAWDAFDARKNERLKIISNELEEAQYKANLCMRYFQKVDPDHRLVADNLESNWERALEDVARVSAKLDKESAQRVPLGEDTRKRLLEMGKDVSLLWEAPSMTPELKKRIVRSVIDKVWASLDAERHKVCLEIQWKGNMTTRIEVDKRYQHTSVSFMDEKVVDLVRLLGKRFSDEGITRHLNRLGIKTGRGNNWTEKRLRSMRSHYKIENNHKDGTHVTLKEAAVELDVTLRQLKKLIGLGWLKAECVYDKAPSLVKKEALSTDSVRKQAENLKNQGLNSPRTQSQPTLF